MYPLDVYNWFKVERQLEEARLARKLEVARLWRERASGRPVMRERLAARAGAVLIEVGRWLVARSGPNAPAGASAPLS